MKNIPTLDGKRDKKKYLTIFSRICTFLLACPSTVDAKDGYRLYVLVTTIVGVKKELSAKKLTTRAC